MKYPILLYLIALALVLSVTLADLHYFVGTDVHLEAYFANQAMNGWNPSIAHPGNSALPDVLIAPGLGKIIGLMRETFPTEYSTQWVWQSIGITGVFKVIYPMLFALVPVILFYIYRRFLTDTQAFLASIFFIAVPTFTMELPQIMRQMFAEVFLALFIYVLLTDKKPLPKAGWLILLGGLVIVSHYSIGVVVMVLMLAYLVILSVMKLFKTKLLTPIWTIGLVTVVLFAGGITYFAKVAGGAPLAYMSAIVPFKAKIGNLTLGYEVRDQLKIITKEMAEEQAKVFEKKPEGVEIKLFTGGYSQTLATSYDEVMKAALGLDFPKASPPGKAFRIVQFITFGLVVIGSVYSLASKRMRKLLKPEYLALIIISGGVLVFCVFSPGFASILNGTRWYHISLFALAPMIVIGMKVILGKGNETIPQA